MKIVKNENLEIRVEDLDPDIHYVLGIHNEELNILSKQSYSEHSGYQFKCLTDQFTNGNSYNKGSTSFKQTVQYYLNECWELHAFTSLKDMFEYLLKYYPELLEV